MGLFDQGIFIFFVFFFVYENCVLKSYLDSVDPTIVYFTFNSLSLFCIHYSTHLEPEELVQIEIEFQYKSWFQRYPLYNCSNPRCNRWHVH